MERREVESAVLGILRDDFEVDLVDLDDSLQDHDLDSLDMVDLEVILERQYNIKFAGEVSSPDMTVSDVVSVVIDKIFDRD